MNNKLIWMVNPDFVGSLFRDFNGLYRTKACFFAINE